MMFETNAPGELPPGDPANNCPTASGANVGNSPGLSKPLIKAIPFIETRTGDPRIWVGHKVYQVRKNGAVRCERCGEEIAFWMVKGGILVPAMLWSNGSSIVDFTPRSTFLIPCMDTSDRISGSALRGLAGGLK